MPKYSAKQIDSVIEYIKKYSKIENAIEHQEIFLLLNANKLAYTVNVQGSSKTHRFLTDKGKIIYYQGGFVAIRNRKRKEILVKVLLSLSSLTIDVYTIYKIYNLISFLIIENNITFNIT